MPNAIGYLRTSSATNVGVDKDSEVRQRDAIESYAKSAGLVVVDWFYDAAVSGADPIGSRPGFVAMLERIAGNGVRSIIVETANRFARDLIVQETGYEHLKQLGIELIAADSPNCFKDDTPTAKFIRQVLGCVAELEKAMTVAKLAGARQRKRQQNGKCEGRKSHQEKWPQVVEIAKDLHSRGMSLQKIAAHLSTLNHLNDAGRVFSPAAVRSMIKGPNK